MKRLCTQSLKFVALVALIALVGSISAFARGAALWGDLAPGPHRVGFNTIEKYDNSRRPHSTTDYFGDIREGSTARPMQICFWYPTEDYYETVAFGEYIFPYPEDDEFFPFVTNIQARQLNQIFALTGGNQGAVLDLQSVPMRAMSNAAPKDGPFPLIFYIPSLNGGIVENAVLCEYLASYGFVVAATHTVGTWDYACQADNADLETRIRDVEFAVATMLDQPFVDASRIGAIGYEFGGAAGLIASMRNADVAVLTCLGSEMFEEELLTLAQANPFYNVQRLRARVLVYRPNEDTSVVAEAIESMPYCDRQDHQLESLNPADMSLAGNLNAMATADSVANDVEVSVRHASLCCRVLHGMEWSLYYDSVKLVPEFDTVQCFGLRMTGKTYPPSAVPPTAAELMEAIRVYGIDTALYLVDEFELANPDSPPLPENQINQMGYQALQRGHVPQALRLFDMNAKCYPNSANVWDSFGEASLAAGDTTNAIEYYSRALELLPGDTRITEGLRQAIQTGATAILQQLRGESTEEEN